MSCNNVTISLSPQKDRQNETERGTKAKREIERQTDRERDKEREREENKKEDLIPTSPDPDLGDVVPETHRLDCSAHRAKAQLAQRSRRQRPSRHKLRESARKSSGQNQVRHPPERSLYRLITDVYHRRCCTHAVLTSFSDIENQKVMFD